MNLDAGTARRAIILFLIGGMLWAYFAPFIPPTGTRHSVWGPGEVIPYIPASSGLTAEQITEFIHAGQTEEQYVDQHHLQLNAIPAHWSVDFSNDQTQQFIGVFLSRMSVIVMLCSIAWIITTRRKPQG